MRVDSFTGTVNITSSTFTNNIATLTGGNYYVGGIYFQNNSAQGTVNIDKTTFSNNSVYMAGGGVYASNIANMIITNSTFTNNTATFSSEGGLSAYGGNLIMSNTTYLGIQQPIQVQEHISGVPEKHSHLPILQSQITLLKVLTQMVYMLRTVSYNNAVGTLPTPTKTGYTFTSWNTQSDELGNTYTSDTVYTLTSIC